jgi:hypothetical protein
LIAAAYRASPLLLALLAPSLPAQPAYDLSWDTPDSVFGLFGQTVRIDASVWMTPLGKPDESGAQGWSLSGIALGGEFVDATFAGTAAADVTDDPPGLRDVGYGVVELTPGGRSRGDECEGRVGVVSAIVLSFVRDVTLPADEPSRILRATVASCDDAADCNADGIVDVSDATFHLAYRFQAGPPPPPPFPDCDGDLVDDGLGCDEYVFAFCP